MSEEDRNFRVEVIRCMQHIRTEVQSLRDEQEKLLRALYQALITVTDELRATGHSSVRNTAGDAVFSLIAEFGDEFKHHKEGEVE